MEYRLLGRSGAAVSSLALGTMTFGRETDEAGSHAQLDEYVSAGGNLVDTADVYSGTESESIIGRWLAARGAAARDDLVIATKGRFPTHGDPNALGLSRKHLTQALDASLRRLQTETIDLYQVHAWDALTPLEETVRTLDDAARAGKIRYWGLSNYTAWQLTKAHDLATTRGWLAPVTLQPQYNLLVRGIEAEIVAAVQDAGMGLLPWSPLAGGWLTGKYSRDEPPAGASRLGEDPERGMEAYAKRSAQERTWRVIDAVRSVADSVGATPAQVALAWLLGRPAVTSVILGARTLEQLRGSLAVVDVVLSDEQVRALDDASDPGFDDYPYGPAGENQRSRRIDGGR
ncbi:aldo/keto reductase [Beutenbergia cavernae DSM 12333]|uniref:Aldo/keto reductase n=1 Tax=Beutenbergia cavernae (strain ATCC BAA-8 / DSM 12333 / CCUG 43141 / JCM 11478 / NBRC 16432 / NCIMB 13614 / HKI 0122) TaxID=471853 RepID=C5C327_BEUC1|nr:aldo/keto reductase [Beutenbergia cavernae]ACQ81871.1 aldo/keto reductase [Beutenbergia cavernae DSM 12333]